MKIFKPQEVDPAQAQEEEALQLYEEYIRWAGKQRGLPNLIINHLINTARANGLPDGYQVPKIPAPIGKP